MQRTNHFEFWIQTDQQFLLFICFTSYFKSVITDHIVIHATCMFKKIKIELMKFDFE